jgi:uncharacterized protein YodC (DUF2158 family)
VDGGCESGNQDATGGEMTLEFKFACKDKVFIKELNCGGTVTAIYCSDLGPQYSVRWFNGHDPKSAYFFERELTEFEPKTPVGFTTEQK